MYLSAAPAKAPKGARESPGGGHNPAYAAMSSSELRVCGLCSQLVAESMTIDPGHHAFLAHLLSLRGAEVPRKVREVNEYSNIRMTSPPNEYSNVRLRVPMAFVRGLTTQTASKELQNNPFWSKIHSELA